MKMNKGRCVFILLATAVLLSRVAVADLGLAQIASEQGAQAVGEAVLAAAQAVYAENTDPAVIQAKLIEILDEAAATGNEEAARYAIVAVMMAGGDANIGISSGAINASSAGSLFPAMVAATIAEVRALLTAAGVVPGGGDSGTTPPPGNPFGPGSPGDTPQDFPATPV